MTIRRTGNKEGEFAYVFCADRANPFLVTPRSRTPLAKALVVASQFDKKNPDLATFIIQHDGEFSAEPTPLPRSLNEIVREILDLDPNRFGLTCNRPFRG